LAAILFPVFAQAKTAAKKTQSVSNVKQIALAQAMYLGDNDDVVVPLYWYDRSLAATSNQGFTYWGLLIYPYTKSYAILECPADRAEDPTLNDAAGRGRFDSKNTFRQYILGANSSYGMNFRYLNVALGPDAMGIAQYGGVGATSIENSAGTVAFAEATMKDRTPPPIGVGVQPIPVRNTIGYSRIEPPFGDPNNPASTTRPRWRFPNNDARQQGNLWPRFNSEKVIVGWFDGHVSFPSMKSLVSQGATQAEVDSQFNGLSK
jgi:prepilin-type processing-associated H-X9-DG protein